MLMFRKVFYYVALTVSLLLSGDSFYSSPTSQSAAAQRRIVFRIATIEETNGARNVVSLTTVEGAPGTDFDVNLQGARFQMKAHFLTDLIASDRLKVRTQFDTRRLYGYSERNLPLFEEDNQRETLEVGFDEAIELFPFGLSGGGDRLKIEITPTWSEENSFTPSGQLRPMTIKLERPSPGNLITVEATKVPHRFALTAMLLEDGREVARGEIDNGLIEEPQEIFLKPNGQASADVLAHPLSVNVGISRYIRSRPADEVAVEFSLYQVSTQPGGRRENIATRWAGIDRLGSSLSYDLSDYYLKSSGRNYELILLVNLAAGERAQ
jgi:hypothetical protein